MRRFIDEAYNHKTLLITRHTKERLERDLEISKKDAMDDFKDVARIEEEEGRSNKRHTRTGIT